VIALLMEAGSEAYHWGASVSKAQGSVSVAMKLAGMAVARTDSTDAGRAGLS
jgi:hypothetical protein